MVMNADGSNRDNLSDKRHSDDTVPIFSPNLETIAFLTNRVGSDGIYVISAGGTE